MKILLIRHGETVDNVAGVYAGTLDSSLTNHGLIQADRLGQYLQKNDYRIRRIFSSDLQRAFLTAQSIDKYQQNDSPISCLKCLREQDFGSYEGKKISSGVSTPKSLNDHVFNETEFSLRKVEGRKSLDARADIFINNHLSALIANEPNDDTVAVVSHAVFLGRLWGALLKRFPNCNIHIQTDLSRKLIGQNLKYLGNWSNTGYLEIDVTKNRSFQINSKPEYSPDLDIPSGHKKVGHGSRKLSDHDMHLHKSNQTNTSEIPRDHSDLRNNRQLSQFLLEVKAINSLDHLDGLQKLRGGTGSLKHDPSQKTIDKYFQKLI